MVYPQSQNRGEPISSEIPISDGTRRKIRTGSVLNPSTKSGRRWEQTARGSGWGGDARWPASALITT